MKIEEFKKAIYEEYGRGWVCLDKRGRVVFWYDKPEITDICEGSDWAVTNVAARYDILTSCQFGTILMKELGINNWKYSLIEINKVKGKIK